MQILINPERVALAGRNRVAVESAIGFVPRVAAAATLGFGAQPLCGIHSAAIASAS